MRRAPRFIITLAWPLKLWAVGTGSLFQAGPVDPGKSSLSLLPHTQGLVPLHSMPMEPQWVSRLQAFMAYLPYFPTCLRNIFLFPLILKLLSHPLSLSRLKQLEGNSPRAPVPHLSLEPWKSAPCPWAHCAVWGPPPSHQPG